MITEARLGDVCDIRSGGTPPRSDTSNYGGQIPWAKIADLDAPQGSITDTEEYITEKGLRAIRGRLFEPGTLLFAMYGSLGKTAIAGTTLSCNQAILGIRVRDEQCLDRRFLFYWLASQQKEFTKSARGVTQKNLSATYIRNLSLPLPTIGEQKRIAAILDAADALRAKRRETLVQLDTLLQSTFLEMFGDPVTNPMCWNSHSLEELSLGIVDGPFGSNLKTSDYVEEGVPVLQGKNITGNQFKWIDVRFISPEKAASLKRSNVVVGDHLLIKIGSIGYSAILDDLNGYEFGIIPANMARIRRNPELVEDAFLHAFLTSEQVARRLRGLASKTAQPALSLKKIKSLSVPLPPRHLQVKFGALSSTIRQQKFRLRAHLNELDTLFASLQARAFAGEL